MASFNHSPYNTPRPSAPFGDIDVPDSTPSSPELHKRVSHSTPNLPETAPALEKHSSGSRSSKRGKESSKSASRASLPATHAQQRKRDLSACSSVSMDSSLTPLSSSSKADGHSLPLTAPPSPIKATAGAKPLVSKPQQNTHLPQPQPPLPPPSKRLLQAPFESSPSEIQKQAPVELISDGFCATLQTTKAQGRTVGFVSYPLLDTAATLQTVLSPQQPFDKSTDAHASPLNFSDSRMTQCPSETTAQPAQNPECMANLSPANVEVAFGGAAASAPGKSPTAERAARFSTHRSAVDHDSGMDRGEKGADYFSASSHRRYNRASEGLAMKKPGPSKTPDTWMISTDGATTLPGADPGDEALIRMVAMPHFTPLTLFGRAKQVLLSPRLGNAPAPRLQHSSTESNKDGSFSLAVATLNESNSNVTTPSEVGRHTSLFARALLRTPIHRQMSSSIMSPLAVDRAILEASGRSPITFDDVSEEERSVNECVKMHMVWQVHDGQMRWTLQPNFLVVSVNERVRIHWYDKSEEIFETDHTYVNVVPGGLHSFYKKMPTSQEGNHSNDTGAEAFEMHDVWSPQGDGSCDEARNYAADRPPGSLATVATMHEGKTDTIKAGCIAPLIIHAHTPHPGRSDLFGGPFNQTGPGACGPSTACQSLRAHHFASETLVIHKREDRSGVAAVSHAADRHGASVREENLFASSVTPPIASHSRQTSSSWGQQPLTATRQAVGENYQSFTVSFRKPGDYYFVSSKYKWTARLHVQVQSQKALACWRYILIIGACIFVVALIVVVVLVLAYWMQKNTYIFGEKGAATSEQYIAFLQIHDLITMKLFPFFAAGVLILLLVILVAIGWTVYRCVHPAPQGAYTRGVHANVRRVVVLATIVLTLALIVFLFIVFSLEMNVMKGVNQLVLSIGPGVTNTLNLYATSVLQVRYVVNETAILFPDIEMHMEKILSITDGVSTLMHQTVKWTSFVEDIAQVAFRAIPVVMYLTMQLSLFAVCLTVGALTARLRKVSAATTWMLAVSLGVLFVVCGIDFAVTQLFSNVYSSVVVLRDDPAGFGDVLGLANDSFVAQLLSYCTVTVDDVSMITSYVNDILSSVNATLDENGQKEFSALFQFIQDMTPSTLEALVNFTDYAIANLDALQRLLDENGAQVDSILQANVVPLLQTVLTVIHSLQGLVNCQVIRDIVSSAIPIFQEEVRSYNTAAFFFLLIVLGTNALLLIFSAASTYAIRHPRRTWCSMRSGRWFRFRYSYKTHVSILMRNVRTEGRKKTILQSLVDSTEPMMYQMQCTKILCYAACMLMFFDSILIALFNEVSHGMKSSTPLRVLSYFGCAVLLFFLLASLFRRAFIRFLLHTCTLMCAMTCLGVSVAQAIIGFVHFGQCIDHTRYELSSLTYVSPVYMTCSATYMGYHLELAIYAAIIFLNSITVIVTLVIYLRYERRLKVFFQRRRYNGILSPLEKLFPCIACLFADHLYVKRIFNGLSIFVTVLFLVLIAVLDIGHWSVIHGALDPALTDSGIVQVIDPTVGCNGDPKYCSLRANEIIWACTHNAHSSLEDGFVLPNHYYNVSHQLMAGVRSFMVDVWYDKINSSTSDEVDVYVCHGVCLMGRRQWRDVAREFKEFLDKYPKQVIMIIFEQYVNSSSLGAISDEVGLTQYVWYSDQVAPNHNPNYQWPTLQHLISKNQRAMIYNDVKAVSSLSENAPPWLYYSFDYQFENGFETPSVSDWVCDVNRGWCTPDTDEKKGNPVRSSSRRGSSSSSDAWNEFSAFPDVTNCSMYGANPLWRKGSAAYNAEFHTNPPNVRSKMSTMNHFITNGAGSPVQATRANQPVQIMSTTYMCASTWNAVVNILAVDFWNIANPLGTIEEMNQNLAVYGRQHNFKDAWSKMLFGTDKVEFADAQ
ncbi:hypothetical protein ABL78_2534 [Leptomonas seymouri]|uniref:Uncharacterized protein n=1 Tax=Leptomonas seymouri TaxID=5684 RepID=A0A0N0P743_LEPSE|nr:hypothetical protein ABL78_2534 [Leptomonas seymouri]|eukprot:KPI88359.1 hypothetical protein ABL78_2534 [Leptomonas seymouri]